MSKEADGKKNIIIKIAEEISSGGMKIIVNQEKETAEKEKE